MMDKKMTSGEIAKKAGVSQKAIRLYDEKGLLKPSEYSEGNYRLYDKEALLVLEKIIALKQIGFSLEEIHDNLITEQNMDITESLKQQLKLMEEKKRELERTIGCIKNVLDRTDGNPDWNNVAEIARMIQMDQSADESHFEALKHTADPMDWYVKIFNSLEIKENARVLDLGCGYGKLWRNNWGNIPENAQIEGIDLHGSWADDFDTYIAENKNTLPEGAEITLRWNDVEDEDIWSESEKTTPYTDVIAHYLLGFLKEPQTLIKRVASVIQKGGMFSCNGPKTSCEHLFWKAILGELKLRSDFIEKELEEKKQERSKFEQLLKESFACVDSVKLSNNMQYDEADELFDRLCSCYPAKKKYFLENKGAITTYFEGKIAENGPIIIAVDSEFWHCYK